MRYETMTDSELMQLFGSGETRTPLEIELAHRLEMRNAEIDDLTGPPRPISFVKRSDGPDA